MYLAEGVRSVRDAMLNHVPARQVFFSPSLLTRTAEGLSLLENLSTWADATYEVDDHILRVISDTETPAGIVAVLRRPEELPLGDVLALRFGVILDGLADPGNAGTIVRTAAAAGAEYVVSTVGSVDLYAPKVTRAGMGSHSRLAIVQDCTWEQICAAASPGSMVACDMSARETIYDISWPSPMALVLGSEAHGLSKEAQAVVEIRVRIPMRGDIESLNASVAAAIVIYEVLGRSIDRDGVRYR